MRDVESLDWHKSSKVKGSDEREDLPLTKPYTPVQRAASERPIDWKRVGE